MISEAESHTLQQAFDYFNQRLFGGILPRAVILLHRSRNARGYFRPEAFAERENGEVLHGVALNPDAYQDRDDVDILSTLVHEQAHLWQQEHGKTSRGGYHNKQWADKMVDIGLMPSSTGQEGGKRTGQRVSHYIIRGGPFEVAANELIAGGFKLNLIGCPKPPLTRPKSKVKYTCEMCNINAWAKPETRLVCGECNGVMESED